MSIIRFMGRLCLAPVFLFGGWDVLENPEKRVKAAADAGTPYPDMAVRVNAAFMVVAGVLVVLGIFPRVFAMLLAGSLVPTTLAGHPYWKKEGPERKMQQTHFLKN